MKIKVSDIPKEGLTISAEYGDEVLEGQVSTREPVVVNLRAEKSGRDIRVKGNIKAQLSLSCSRCLEEFPWNLESEFDFVLVAPEKNPQTEKELTPEELDISFFDGEYVDVAQITAEQIFLHIPIKTLCDSDCKGLCPQCGVNLNTEQCQCPPQTRTSPFEALKNIKPEKQGE